MKITDVRAVVVGNPWKNWVFVIVETDEGITGLGECTDYFSNPHLVRGIESIKPLVVGEDPANIEEIWQTIFHAYSDLNPRGYISHLISAIDIALWDIKGKVLGVPIYQLLGGPVRDHVPLYTHPGGGTLEEMVASAVEIKNQGFEATKTDPFSRQRSAGKGFRGADSVERLNARAIAEGVERMEALREALGPDYELMVDAHARFDVASAIAAANALEHVDLIWLEEPTHVENHEALRQIRENTNVPLCVGERHFTRWDYIPLLQQRLVDYIMPDVAWCGGISEQRRIAALAEPYFIRISPHDALGPVNIAAGFQVCMNTPNVYREECVSTWFPMFEKIITPMFDIRDGSIYPNDQPGLGIELIHDVVDEYLVDPNDLDKLTGRER
ncbi:MAG: mandelate racemase/muconate lactonizing enzyme family protein [Chloroflexi bacterium]|nr:mandelate racemase/muconate lactonizing enzyme family protein [Chloroflexota bacterium]